MVHSDHLVLSDFPISISCLRPREKITLTIQSRRERERRKREEREKERESEEESVKAVKYEEFLTNANKSQAALSVVLFLVLRFFALVEFSKIRTFFNT